MAQSTAGRAGIRQLHLSMTTVAACSGPALQSNPLASILPCLLTWVLLRRLTISFSRRCTSAFFTSLSSWKPTCSRGHRKPGLTTSS